MSTSAIPVPAQGMPAIAFSVTALAVFCDELSGFRPGQAYADTASWENTIPSSATQA